jgi:hypothetical protein
LIKILVFHEYIVRTQYNFSVDTQMNSGFTNVEDYERDFQSCAQKLRVRITKYKCARIREIRIAHEFYSLGISCIMDIGFILYLYPVN